MAKTKNNQPQLPFILEGNVASRDQVRSLAKNVTQLYKVPLAQIRIRPGFNARVQGDVPNDLWMQILMIPDLADGIFASNGPDDPVIGDFYKVDDYFYVTEGERRILALRHLIATGRETYPNGNPVDEVSVLLNPAGTTDLERKRKIGTSGNKLPLTPMQRAFYYLNLKTEFNLSHEQIAEMFPPMSRQTVDNYVLATELPAAVQQDIDADKVKITNAISDLRKSRNKKHDSDDSTPSQDTHKRKKDKEAAMDGDEDDISQQDNSLNFAGSKSGPKESGSGAVVIGKDASHKDQEDTAKWKQFIHRLRVLEPDCAKAADGDQEVSDKKLIERLKMEYIIQVK